ncbi:hypothetical protein [Paenibacillus sp. Soil766]|uniref:hypothetical protein n=1 Tax=Paenibacillus sp. Soil766 TaxID=1736404 RepID=UPI001F1E885E|nr:hypothetical protein [Paenibacillus sp. Soil766]
MTQPFRPFTRSISMSSIVARPLGLHGNFPNPLMRIGHPVKKSRLAGSHLSPDVEKESAF